MNNKKLVEQIEKATQPELFKRFWIHSNKKSFLSGLWLRDQINSKFAFNTFAHVLAKGNFEHFKLYAGNIVLLTKEEHSLLDHGTEEKRISYSKKVKTADWSKIEDLKAKILEEYELHFPKMKNGIIMKYSPEEVFETIKVLNKQFFETDRLKLNMYSVI